MLHPESRLIRFLTKQCDLMLLNIIFVFAFLTIVFSGTAITALYATTMKMIQGKEYAPVKGFLRAARENFVTSVPATILLFIDVMLMAVFCSIPYAGPLAVVLLSIAIVFLTALLSYLFPLLACFKNTFPRHFRNAGCLALANLPVTFLLAAVNLLPLLCIVFCPGALVYFAAFEQLIGIAAGALLNSFYLNRIFSR